jgi:hypothetical protein
VALEDGHLLVLGAEDPVDLGVRVAAEKVEPGNTRWPVELEVRDGDGSLGVAGSVRLEPIGFAGKVDWKELQIPRLIAASGVALPAELQSGKLAGSLRVTAGMENAETAETTADVEIQGTVEVAEFGLREGEADLFTVAWERFAIDLARLRLPGVMGDVKSESEAQPIELRLNQVVLAKPDFRLTRTSSGLVLPSGQTEDSASTETEEGTKAGNASPSLRMEIADVELDEGRVTFVDQAFTPAQRQRLSDIHLEARGIAWPDRRVEELALDMKGPGDAKWNVTGKGKTGATDLEIALKQLGLERFDPYAKAHAGYAIRGGSASLTSKVELTRKTYDSDNRLVLHELAVSTSDGGNLFRDQFGVPLPVAVSLMRDAKGDITLDVPMRGERTGTRLGFTSAITSAMRQAIMSALSSPLKLVGAVGLPGGKGEGIDAAAVSFRAGSDKPDEEGLERLKQLADLLSARPALALRLEGTVGKADEKEAEEAADLAKARAEKAKTVLEKEHDIDPKKIELVPFSGEIDERGGGVEIEFGAAIPD